MKVLKNKPSEIMSITPSTPLRSPDTATMSNNDSPNTMVRTANTLKLMRQIAFMQGLLCARQASARESVDKAAGGGVDNANTP